METNIPPFYVGQKIVTTNSDYSNVWLDNDDNPSSGPAPNEIVTVERCALEPHGWEIFLKEYPKEPGDGFWYQEKDGFINFKPAETIKASIMTFSQIQEKDKILIVNN